MRPAASAAVELAGPASARGEGDEARRGREEEQSADAVALSEAVAEEVGFGADDTVDVSANSGGSASGGSFAAAAAVTPSSGGHARRSSGSASLPGSDGGPESAEASRASDVDGIALAWGSGLRSVLVALAMVAPRPRGAADGGPTIGDALRYGLFAVGRLVMLGNFLWRVAWALAVTDYEHELERYAWVMIISAPFSLFLGFVFARPDVLLAAPAREFALRKDVARAYLTTISRATTVSLVCFASLIIGLINAAHWGPLARGEPPSGMTSSLEMRAFERFGAAWTLLFIVSNSVFVVAAFQGGMYFIYHMLLLMYALRCLRRRATALQGAEGCESVAASYAAVAHAIIRFRRTFLVPFVCSCVLAVGSQLLYLVLFAQQSGRYPSFAALSIPATGFVNLFTNAAVAYKLVRYQLVARRAIASRIAALMRKEQWAASSELAPHSARLVAQLARPSPVEKIILGDAPLQALARITTRRLTLEQRHRVAWLPIHARLLLEAFGAISPSLFVLMAVRAMAQNPPRCVTFDGKRLVSDCSLRVNALRAWERVTLGFYFNLSTIFTLAALITGWPLVRAQLRRFLWMPPAAYLLLMAAAYPLAVLAEDDLDPVPAITFYCVSLLFLLCTRHYIAQLRGSASIANRLAFGGVSIIALHGFLSLFILPLFVAGSESTRLVAAFIYFPLIREAFSYATRLLIANLHALATSDDDSLQFAWFFHFINEATFAILGRVLLFRVSSVSAQVGSAVLWGLFEFSKRAAGPLPWFVLRVPFRGLQYALQRLEEQRLSPLTVHYEYVKMVTDYSATLVVPTFLLSMRAYFGLALPNVGLVVLSAAAQLGVALVTDACSCFVEIYYWSYDASRWRVAQQRRDYLRVFLCCAGIFSALGPYCAPLVYAEPA